MNSLIITFLYGIFKSVYAYLNESRVWKLLGKVHGFFSNAFSGSLAVNLAKRKGQVVYEETSLVCRLLRIPTAVLSALTKFFSGLIKKITYESDFIKYYSSYMFGFRILNLRFFALMLLFAGGTGFVIKPFLGEFSLIHGAVAVLGFAVSFIKGINFSDHLDGSAVLNIVKKFIGCEDVKFGKYKTVKAPHMYMTAAVVGIITGIAGEIHWIMYALPVALFAVGFVFQKPVMGIIAAVFIAPILPTLALVGVCLLTIGAVLCRKALTGEYGIKMGRLGLCLMLFVIIGFISTLLSPSMVKSVGVWGMYVIFIAFYYIIRDTVRDEITLEAILKAFALSAAAVSVYGILQYVFEWDTRNAWIDTDMFEEATMRAYSTLANPNVLGEYLLLALPVTAWVFFNYAKTGFQKLTYLVTFVAAFVCLILTQSRGCWIGFLASAVVFVTYYRSSLWKLAPLVLIILPFVLPETIINRFTSVGDLSDSSTSYRVFIWMGTLRMLKYYWLGGIGPGEGAFAAIYPEFSYNGIVAPHSHNLFLQLVVDSGIINLAVFGMAMLIFFKDMLNIQAENKKHGLGAMALISAVVGFLVQSMFDYTFYNFRVMAIFFMVLAIGGALVSITSQREAESE